MGKLEIMKKIIQNFLCLLILLFLILISCRKFADGNLGKKHSITYVNNNESIIFKEIGNIKINEDEFPLSWKVNTYDDENFIISKKDEDYQKKFEQIDYFNNLKEGLAVNSSTFSTFIKKDSLLNLSDITSLNIIDSVIINENYCRKK